MHVKLKIVKLAIPIIGACLIALSAIWLYPVVKELSWKRVSATVLSSTVYPAGMGVQPTVTVREAEVHYSYVVKESELTGRGTYHYPGPTTLASAAQMGTIEILYNPAKPEESIIQGPFPAVAALLGLLGIAGVIFAGINAVRSRRLSSTARPRAGE